MKEIAFVLIINFTLIINATSNDIINAIEKNWNDTQSMSGEFLQTDTDGNISRGYFYFLKPYNTKFEYFDRDENIITNQSLLRIVDQNGYQLESYSFRNNILKKLLSEKVSINKEFNLISLSSSENMHQMFLHVKNKNRDRIQLSFDRFTFDLKKWEIYDEFDNKTVLEFTKIKKNVSISQDLFMVKYKKFD